MSEEELHQSRKDYRETLGGYVKRTKPKTKPAKA